MSHYLAPGLVNAINWEFQLPFELRNGGPSTHAAGRWILGTAGIGLPGGGPPICNYKPPPADVTAQDGTPAPGFLAFPLTLL
jgi:hypothetical protein